ncbi:MAG: hypothetical protein J0M15_16210 [Deltaproteobacteria bacterium]|jgi:hypothetical protein|nr:hypothetical protein [Deltaproteobacteria bacterium]
MKYWLLIISLIPLVGMSRTELISKFDHQMHEKKVFQKNKISCTHCHNLENGKDNNLLMLSELEKFTFKKTFKQICHDCHQGDKDKEAPKTCYTCHNTPDKLGKIKPQSHEGGFWKNQHANQAKVEGNECQKCHSQNQCVKCHSSKNPVINNNHSRNYKYFHSIEARSNPQKCDTCHGTSYCIRCHVGGIK